MRSLHAEINPTEAAPENLGTCTSSIHSVFYQLLTSKDLREHRQAMQSLNDIQMRVSDSVQTLTTLMEFARFIDDIGEQKDDIQDALATVAGLGKSCSEMQRHVMNSDVHVIEQYQQDELWQAYNGESRRTKQSEAAQHGDMVRLFETLNSEERKLFFVEAEKIVAEVK